MRQKVILFTMLASTLSLFAGYNEGRAVFESKCSSCHVSHISAQQIQENFFEKNNTMLNLKAPSVNMLAYAIMDGPKHIGEKGDTDMRDGEIEDYLKEYLTKPDIHNSICDPQVMKFYKVKKSMKGQVTDKEFTDLASFFMNYKKMRSNKSSEKKKGNTK